MKCLTGLLSLLVALTASAALRGQEKTEPRIALPADVKGEDELTRLRREVAKLRKDIQVLESKVNEHTEVILVNQKAIQVHSELLKDTATEIQAQSKALVANGLILKDIAKQLPSGRWAPDLVSSMSSPVYRQDVQHIISRSTTSAKLRIFNPSYSDEFLYINGVRWRFLAGTEHYVPVTFGRVAISREYDPTHFEFVQDAESRVYRIQLGFPPVQ